MDIFEAIQGRRSVRKYENRPVEQEKVGMLLEACRWSPSAGNRQPWEIVIVDNPEIIEKLACASLDQMWMKTAPLILAMCLNENIAKGTYGERGELYALQTMGMAAENIMLAAHSLGLGSCCVGAFEEGEVRKILKCLDIIRPVALITVGYPREEPRVPDRDNISQFTYCNHYGKQHAPDWPGAQKIGRKIRKKLLESLEKC